MRAVAIVSIHVIMSNTEHPAGAAHRFFRCTFGPVREVDLVWPPPDAEIDAFSIVHLDDGDAQTPRVEAPPIEPPPAEPVRLEVAPARLAASSPRSATVELWAPRLVFARWSCRWNRHPHPGRPCPIPPVVRLPPAIPEEARVAEMPADDIHDRSCQGSAAAADSPGHAALGSRDSRRPSIGVAGGVLRGGVRLGDDRRVSRRRLAIGRARGAADSGRCDRGGMRRRHRSTPSVRPRHQGPRRPSVQWPPRRFLRRRRSWRAPPSRRRPWRRRLPGRASRSQPRGARSSRPVRPRRT